MTAQEYDERQDDFLAHLIATTAVEARRWYPERSPVEIHIMAKFLLQRAVDRMGNVPADELQ